MHSSSPRIGIISLSRILNDPRVRRQCEALQASGFRVFSIGEDEEDDETTSWTIVRQPEEKSEDETSKGHSLRAILKRTVPPHILKRLAVALGAGFIWKTLRRLNLVIRAQLCRLSPHYAHSLFWAWNSKINDLYRKGKSLHCDAWLANDWITLPIAAKLASENGGIYLYDTHEFATEEYHERLLWRIAQKPVVVALESSFIKEAKLVTAVSSGISSRLTELYQLASPAITIRNIPPYSEVPFRRTPRTVRVLYHGIVAPGRGLEATIDSVSLWAPDRNLYIRGPGSESYVSSIRERISQADLQTRVFLLPSVHMTELVRAAAEFDIGFFALPGHSLHNQYALPNKFFEYIMAGLALCVSALPEMQSLVTKYDLGETFKDVDPSLIATAINKLSHDDIDRFKKNSLIAARELCWEAESSKFVSALSVQVSERLN